MNFAKARPNIYIPLSVSIKLVRLLQTSNKLRLIASFAIDSPKTNNRRLSFTCIYCIILITATGSTAEIMLAKEK